MNEQSSAIPTSFWIISVVALVWNLLGIANFFGAMSRGDLAEMAIWGAAGFAVAVFCGAVGCVLLLVKRAAAEQVFILSLVGVVVHMMHNFFVAELPEEQGAGFWVLVVMIPAIAAFLIWYARLSKARGWIG